MPTAYDRTDDRVAALRRAAEAHGTVAKAQCRYRSGPRGALCARCGRRRKAADPSGRSTPGCTGGVRQ